MPQQGIELEGKELYVCRKNKLILENASFKVRPGTLTAIIGPNGAGKTTMMKALSGERPDYGQVLINGENLYDDPQYWLQQIGYVPVNNILHEQLSIKQALIYIGQLRLPQQKDEESYLWRARIEERVDQLLTDFDFPPDDPRRDRPIKFLSSGERKRTNVCAELIIDPPLLMLDEPTSNLDPDAERNLMQLLARYARDNNQTILVITHTLNTIDVCDEVIFIENSRVAADGERAQVLTTLEAEVESADATAAPFYRWAAVFDRYKTRDDERNDCSGLPTTSNNAPVSVAKRELAEMDWGHQFRTLIRRYMKVRMGDRWSLIGTLLAGLSGILFFILPGDTFVKPLDPGELALSLNQARQSVYVVALVVTLLGLITSYTEISKEFHIYQHERLKGLSPSAYFMSKWVWLTVGVGILAPLLMAAFIFLVYRQPLPGFPVPRFGEEVSTWEMIYRFQLVGMLTKQSSWLVITTLVLSCITSVTLGLFISAITGDSDKGYLYLSFVVVFIVLFSGLIQNDKLDNLVDTMAFLSTGKWAYEGFSSTVSVYCWLDSWRFDEFNSAGHIVSVWLALMAFTLAAAFLSIIVLRTSDPWFSRWRNVGKLITQEWPHLMVYIAAFIMLMSLTAFLRGSSRDYHELNYWGRQEYGGTNAYEYANISKVENPTTIQLWNGKLSQSWCGDRN